MGGWCWPPTCQVTVRTGNCPSFWSPHWLARYSHFCTATAVVWENRLMELNFSDFREFVDIGKRINWEKVAKSSRDRWHHWHDTMWHRNVGRQCHPSSAVSRWSIGRMLHQECLVRWPTFGMHRARGMQNRWTYGWRCRFPPGRWTGKVWFSEWVVEKEGQLFAVDGLWDIDHWLDWIPYDWYSIADWLKLVSKAWLIVGM